MRVDLQPDQMTGLSNVLSEFNPGIGTVRISLRSIFRGAGGMMPKVFAGALAKLQGFQFD
jgi:hypothetical protein